MITILFIDDESFIRSLVKNYLEISGELKVDLAPSAEEAVDMMKGAIYDAIVCDYEMPGGMNGIDLLRRIREAGNTIPFLIFTGRGQEEVAIDAINCGADFYIQKGKANRGQFADLVQKIIQAVQRRRTEDALRESERNYRNLVENLPDIILTTDQNGDIISLNSTGAKILGIQPDPMLHQPWTSILEPGDIKRAGDMFNAMISGKEALKELPARLSPPGHGSEGIPVIITGSPVQDDRGSINGARLLFRDMSRLTETAEQLRATAETLNTLLSMLPLAVITLDRQGTVKDWNPGAADLLGWTDEETMGNFFPAVPMDKVPEFRRLLLRCLQVKGVHHLPFQARRRDGTMADLALYAAPLRNQNGKAENILLIARENFV